jgi:hypothetical protein
LDTESFLRVEPFLTGLKYYCFKLTKNEWDAQDLMQEALTKIYRTIKETPNREFNKAYCASLRMLGLIIVAETRLREQELFLTRKCIIQRQQH